MTLPVVMSSSRLSQAGRGLSPFFHYADLLLEFVGDVSAQFRCHQSSRHSITNKEPRILIRRNSTSRVALFDELQAPYHQLHSRRARRDQADHKGHSIPVSYRERSVSSISGDAAEVLHHSWRSLFTSHFVVRGPSRGQSGKRGSLSIPARDVPVPAIVPKSSHHVAQAKHAHHSRSDLLLQPEQELHPVEASPAKCCRGSRGYPPLSSRVDLRPPVVLYQTDLQTRHEFNTNSLLFSLRGGVLSRSRFRSRSTPLVSIQNFSRYDNLNWDGSFGTPQVHNDALLVVPQHFQLH